MHKQAAFNTAKILASGMASGLLIMLAVQYLSLDTIMTICGIAIFGYIIHIFYSIEKSRLESLERLNKE